MCAQEATAAVLVKPACGVPSSRRQEGPATLARPFRRSNRVLLNQQSDPS
jgi:hypothetical protein